MELSVKKFRCKASVLLILYILMGGSVFFRFASAIWSLNLGDSGQFLAFPLGVIVPLLVFVFMARRPGFLAAEGALMQLGVLIQLCIIVMFSPLALYLTLGFPVVFLIVELFETRIPRGVRDPLRRFVLA